MLQRVVSPATWQSVVCETPSRLTIVTSGGVVGALEVQKGAEQEAKQVHKGDDGPHVVVDDGGREELQLVGGKQEGKHGHYIGLHAVANIHRPMPSSSLWTNVHLARQHLHECLRQTTHCALPPPPQPSNNKIAWL